MMQAQEQAFVRRLPGGRMLERRDVQGSGGDNNKEVT